MKYTFKYQQVPEGCTAGVRLEPVQDMKQPLLSAPHGWQLEGEAMMWSGTESTSSFTRTYSDGTFAVVVPDGSFSLDVYASPSEHCTFVGWYGPDGFTTERESAIHVLAYGESVSGIEIILPRELDELPFIEWCA